MSANEPEAAVDVAAGWARMLAGLRDIQVQVGWVREQLTLLGAARAADVLTVVLARAEQREERYSILLLRVSLALAAPELAGFRRAIAGIASVRCQSGLADFLGAECEGERTASAESSSGGDETQAGDETRTKEPRQPGRRESSKGRPLSLGERKSLARRRDRNLLARVLRDPHPDVVRILLDNPALTEIDVVRLCARRPVSPDVLAQVFLHGRWVVRYRVRLTLALNPHTPEPVALQLLPHLTPHDLREVARSSDVSERVRHACATPPPRRGELH